MNAAHLHLVLNHIPIIGTVITIFVLIAGLFMKSDEVKKVSLMIILLTALITIPVYLSGKDAEEMIEGNYEDVEESLIEEHEDFALYSFIAMDIAGFIALLGLIIYKKPKLVPMYFAGLMLLILLVVNGMMGWTANLGGRIHHPEIREDRMPWEPAIENIDSNGENETEEGDENSPNENEADEKKESEMKELKEKDDKDNKGRNGKGKN